MTASETALFDRVRQSGTCPPSLLKEGGFGEGDDGFAAAVLSVLDGATGTLPYRRCFLMNGDPPLQRNPDLAHIPMTLFSSILLLSLLTGIALRSDASAGTEFDKAIKVRNV